LDLRYPCQNALGYAGWRGELNSWWDLGSFQAKHDLLLPIRINFNNAQTKVGNSVLGWNWWLPVLESTVVRVSEDHTIMNLIGGKTVDLWKSKRDPLIYRSPDLEWECKVNERGSFISRNKKDNFEITFLKGRIQSIAFSEREKLYWEYDNTNKPLFVKNELNEVILGLIYDQNGFPKRMNYKSEQGKDESIDFSVQELPVFPGKRIPALVAVDANENSTKAFRYERAGNVYSLVSSKGVNGQLVPDNLYKWDISDGKILEAQEYVYKVNIVENTPYSFAKTKPDGACDTYTFDRQTGASRSTYADGTVIDRKYILTGGPNFYKEREFLKKNGDTLLKIAKNFDKNGEMLRRVVTTGQSDKSSITFEVSDADEKQHFSDKNKDWEQINNQLNVRCRNYIFEIERN